MAPRSWQIGKGEIPLGERPRIMGILNVTPDSFSDGGLHDSPAAAFEAARRMESDGADIIDIGGVSTRPGSDPVPPEEEIRRVVPVIRLLRDEVSLPISIDTYRTSVAREAIAAGATIVNDVSGLRASPDMADLVAESRAGVVIMHMQGIPRDMQDDPRYDDVVQDIRAFFQERIAHARSCHVPDEAIVLDPGIGFGKRLHHNLALIHQVSAFRDLGFPLLLGPSRKSFIGEITNRSVKDRLPGTAAAVALAVAHGVEILRVHDVQPMRDVVDVAHAISRSGP
jgi:dihydropteroate synthase